MSSKLAGLEAILAVNSMDVIGVNGDLPWSLKADMRRFAEITAGHYVLMGRKTAESLPQPLRGRECYILTSKGEKYRSDKGKGVSRWEHVYAVAQAAGKKLFVIGGAHVYDLLFPLCSVIHLTEVFDGMQEFADAKDVTQYNPWEVMDDEEEWSESLEAVQDEDENNEHLHSYTRYTWKGE